ncbi:MAG TPA: DEAD/DEAH box helicase family protein [Polyangiaceae bacterium]|jgi:superfamily II DNA or RNA helicase
MVSLAFAGGTLLLKGLPLAFEGLPVACQWDHRIGCFRAPGLAYADLVQALTRAQIAFEDQARAYHKLDVSLRAVPEPRPFQNEALEAWIGARGRGVVVLPTGSGKSHLALMAIENRRRSALIVAPTLDLVRQWYDLLRHSYGTEIGVVGGGEYSVHPFTVTTYDSAYLHMDQLGARFGLVVFDECHHLPGVAFRLAARFCLAPYRLGLTATPERADGLHAELKELIGPVVYSKGIGELSGQYLSDYQTQRVSVELSAEERNEYESERAVYLGFLRAHGIRIVGPGGWKQFIRRAAGSAAGQRALQGYRRQRELAFAASAKLDYVGLLLTAHRLDRILIFTQDNATAHAVSRRFLIPVITHETKLKERSEILERFADGRYNAVATSKVLNEGVDVPDANVAIVISGSGSVREHVQRLGRILRRKGEKRATLYELITAGTSETGVSERRREHEAYR